MKGFQMIVSGNWGHFKKPETNNNPLTHDLMTKTAFIGMIGAVLGIERVKMRQYFPVLSEDLLYGICLLSPVRKIAWGFTSKKANNPTGAGVPKNFEMLKDPAYMITVGLKNSRSEDTFSAFLNAINKGESVYTPVLGLHNCPANLEILNLGEISEVQNGCFKTRGFVVVGRHVYKDFSGKFRIGFDRMPTYQNNDFWNIPDKYVDIIYPDNANSLTVEGPYYKYISESNVEEWYLV